MEIDKILNVSNDTFSFNPRAHEGRDSCKYKVLVTRQ